MVSKKKTLLVFVLLCVTSLVLFHFSSKVTQGVSWTVDYHSLLRSQGLSDTLVTSSPRSGTNSTADLDNRVHAAKKSSPPIKTSLPAPSIKTTLPATPAPKQECSCDQSDFHFVSLEEFKSTFSQHNSGGLASFHTNYTKDSYTVVIPSYKRDNAIPTHLRHYCNAPHVHKILFLWQNVERPVPSRFLDQSCGVPYKFIVSKRNSLSNRFILHEEIETEAVFTIDDDTSESYVMLNTAFEAWKAYPHLLVGFISRTHSVVHDRYHYYDGPTCYSIILTTAAFVHRKYLELYSSPEVEKLRVFVDLNMNGEDIVMNGIVSNYLRQTGVDLNPACHTMLVEGGRKELVIPGAGYMGIYARRGHQEKRDKCVNLLADFFGSLPLTCCHYHIKLPPGTN